LAALIQIEKKSHSECSEDALNGWQLSYYNLFEENGYIFLLFQYIDADDDDDDDDNNNNNLQLQLTVITVYLAVVVLVVTAATTSSTIYCVALSQAQAPWRRVSHTRFAPVEESDLTE